MEIRLKRAYEEPQDTDGFRILVDRLWPRGVSRESAGIDLWLKEIAPSSELRRWFAHDPAKWKEFRQRYVQELDRNSAAVEEVIKCLREGRVTLVYAAKDEEHNNAVVIREYLEQKKI